MTMVMCVDVGGQDVGDERNFRHLEVEVSWQMSFQEPSELGGRERGRGCIPAFSCRILCGHS